MANADVSDVFFICLPGDPGGKKPCFRYHLRPQAEGGTQGRGISFSQYGPN